jgi:hypothetical protein
VKIVHMLLGNADRNTMGGVNEVVHALALEHRRAGHGAEVWGRTDTPHERALEAEVPLPLCPAGRTRFVLAPELRATLDGRDPPSWVRLRAVFIAELRAVAAALRRRGVRSSVVGSVSGAALARPAG